MGDRTALQPDVLEFLFSAEAQVALDELGAVRLDEAGAMSTLFALRKRFPAPEAGALLSLAQARGRAVGKFPDAAKLFLTPEAVEQATAMEVAAHRAAWIDRCAPPGIVLDLGCGVGGDLIALAQQRRVIAYEIDPVRARFAAANVAAVGLADRVEVRCADWVEAMHTGALPPAAAAFIDPARRVDNRRVFHLDEVQPPIREIVELAVRMPVTGVKVMPGVEERELPTGCGVEFVSHEGVCKEAVLWFGPANWHRRWATILGLDVVQAPVDEISPPVGEIAPGMVLYEPDPALIRAQALGWMCGQLGAHLFDDQIAYLVASRWRPLSYAQAFAIDEIWPFSLKRLNERLEALGAGTLELKKRGFPVAPESLRAQLHTTPGGCAITVIFTRRADERLMVIGRRLSNRLREEGN